MVIRTALSLADAGRDRKVGSMFDQLTVDYLAERTDHASFDRGQKIDPQRVEITERTDNVVRSTVTAPHEYHVRLILSGADLQAECDCAIEHEWCRHAVATALKLISERGKVFTPNVQAAAAAEAVFDDEIDTFVANLRHDQLVQLVRNLRVAQPNVDLVLEVGAAEHGGGCLLYTSDAADE